MLFVIIKSLMYCNLSLQKKLKLKVKRKVYRKKKSLYLRTERAVEIISSCQNSTYWRVFITYQLLLH